MDQGAQVHAHQPEVGSGMGHLTVLQQINLLLVTRLLLESQLDACPSGRGMFNPFYFRNILFFFSIFGKKANCTVQFGLAGGRLVKASNTNHVNR